MHRMHLDHIHSSRVSYSSSMSISPSVLSPLLLSPVSAAHMLMGIGPSTGAWATYGGHTLEGNWLLPQQLSTAGSSSAGVDFVSIPFTWSVLPCWLLVGRDSHSCSEFLSLNSPTMSRSHCWWQSFLTLGSLQSFCSFFHDAPWALGQVV